MDILLPKCVQLHMSSLGVVNLQIPSEDAATSFLLTDNDSGLFLVIQRNGKMAARAQNYKLSLHFYHPSYMNIRKCIERNIGLKRTFFSFNSVVFIFHGRGRHVCTVSLLCVNFLLPVMLLLRPALF